MLRIIQNEFAKILHKVSSLVLFIILLLILIGIPVGSKIIDSIDFSSSYYQDLEQSLEYAKQDSYQDPLYIEQLETAIEIGLRGILWKQLERPCSQSGLPIPLHFGR